MLPAVGPNIAAGSHAVMLSHPKDVAAFIEAAATAADPM